MVRVGSVLQVSPREAAGGVPGVPPGGDESGGLQREAGDVAAADEAARADTSPSRRDLPSRPAPVYQGGTETGRAFLAHPRRKALVVEREELELFCVGFSRCAFRPQKPDCVRPPRRTVTVAIKTNIKGYDRFVSVDIYVGVLDVFTKCPRKNKPKNARPVQQ